MSKGMSVIHPSEFLAATRFDTGPLPIIDHAAPAARPVIPRINLRHKTAVPTILLIIIAVMTGAMPWLVLAVTS